MTTKSGATPVSIAGIEDMGSRFVPGALVNTVVGHYDPERIGLKELKLRGRDGARDVSPTLAEEAFAKTGRSPEDAMRQVVRELLTRVHHGIVQANAQDGLTIVAHQDAALVESPLRELHTHLPLQRLVCLTPWPEGGRDGHGKGGCSMLRCRGFVNATGHYGPRSPFAKRNSADRLDQFVVALHNALVRAPHSHAKNPTIGQIFETLGSWAPCFQYGFASLPLPLARKRRVWGALKRIGGGPFTAGSGDLDATLRVAARATELAHEPQALSTPEPLDPAKPHFVVHLVPFAARSKPFQELAERQGVWLASAYPAAEAVFVSGNGVAPLDEPGERFLQVSVLAPLPCPPARGE